MISQLVSTLTHAGVKANHLTFLGFIFSAITMIFIGQGHFTIAFFMMVLAAACDLLDGKLARARNHGSKFGAILDSSIDRYSDALYYAGFIYYFMNRYQHDLFAVLAFSACVGSFAISYIKARAEGLGFSCNTGFWERPERVIVLMISLLVNNTAMAIAILGVSTHFTAMGRLYFCWKMMKPSGSIDQTKPGVGPKSRLSVTYVVPMCCIAIAVFFIRF